MFVNKYMSDQYNIEKAQMVGKSAADFIEHDLRESS